MNLEHRKCFMTAAGLLPERLWRGCYTLSDLQKEACEELRVRLGRPLAALVGGRMLELREGIHALCPTGEEMDEIMARATGSSVHSHAGQLASGFVTSANGHRIGVCGEAVSSGGKITTLRAVTSLNIRIAKEHPGIAGKLIDEVLESDNANMLILAPPGAGKTTLLREIARRLSFTSRVAILDERYEIAACAKGQPMFDVGRSDVLSGAGKRQGLDMLIRSMSPQVVVVDEITKGDDVDAMVEGAYSGCSFIATAHAREPRDLIRRPVYRRIIEENIFDTLVTIENHNGARSYKLWKKGELRNDKDFGCGADCGVMLGNGFFYEQWTERQDSGPEKLYVGL